MGKITRKELSDELNNELDSYSTKNELQTLDSKVMSHLAEKVYKGSLFVNVKDFGAVGDGITDDTNAIQNAINSITGKEVLYFPSGTYLIGNTIILKENIAYVGAGMHSTVIKQKDNANLSEMFLLPSRTDRQHYGFSMKDLTIDGNKSENINTVGLFINCAYFAQLENIRVINTSGTAIYFNGNSTIKCDTCHLKNVHVYGAGVYGIYISEYCLDMHVIGGDIGYNWMEGIYIKSPSSSIRNVTVWGSQSTSGIVISKEASSVQIMNCQIEGHAKHGIEIYASHVFVTGNKIYDNANTPDNYGLYSGVYVASTDGTILENIIITGNAIYSGLYSQTGYHKAAIEFADTNHENATIIGNSVKYLGNGVVDTSRPLIIGLRDSDACDYSWNNSYFHAYPTTSQNVVTGDWSKLIFDSKIRDSQNEYNPTTGEFTVLHDGIYQLEASVLLDNITEGELVQLEIRINDGAESYRIDAKRAGGNGWHVASGSITLYLHKGFKISLHLYSELGGNVVLGKPYNYFIGRVMK